MADLIDRGALIQDLKEHKIPFNADINEAIIVAPTVDAEPITHGRWIPVTKGALKEIYICSRCHRQIEDDGIPALIPQRYPYCHCGAKMTLD